MFFLWEGEVVLGFLGGWWLVGGVGDVGDLSVVRYMWFEDGVVGVDIFGWDCVWWWVCGVCVVFGLGLVG